MARRTPTITPRAHLKTAAFPHFQSTAGPALRDFRRRCRKSRTKERAQRVQTNLLIPSTAAVGAGCGEYSATTSKEIPASFVSLRVRLRDACRIRLAVAGRFNRIPGGGNGRRASGQSLECLRRGRSSHWAYSLPTGRALGVVRALVRAAATCGSMKRKPLARVTATGRRITSARRAARRRSTRIRRSTRSKCDGSHLCSTVIA
jgi:hypothetical protein